MVTNNDVTAQHIIKIVKHHEERGELLTPDEIGGILTIIGHPLTEMGVRSALKRLSEKKYLGLVRSRKSTCERPKHRVLFVSDEAKRLAILRVKLHEQIRDLDRMVDKISRREANWSAQQRMEDKFGYEVVP